MDVAAKLREILEAIDQVVREVFWMRSGEANSKEALYVVESSQER